MISTSDVQEQTGIWPVRLVADGIERFMLLVGRRDRPECPVAVDDVARILTAAATGDGRLRNRTIAVLGPEGLALGEAVRRVGEVIGRRPLYVRLPVVAQVHILAEGVVEASPAAKPPPPDLAPTTPFTPESIRAGLPEDPERFGCRDLRWCRG